MGEVIGDAANDGTRESNICIDEVARDLDGLGLDFEVEAAEEVPAK